MRFFDPAGNYMFKVNNRDTRTRCEICSKLTIKIPERLQQVNAGWGGDDVILCQSCKCS